MVNPGLYIMIGSMRRYGVPVVSEHGMGSWRAGKCGPTEDSKAWDYAQA